MHCARVAPLSKTRGLIQVEWLLPNQCAARQFPDTAANPPRPRGELP
jgi:hypothetical protein